MKYLLPKLLPAVAVVLASYIPLMANAQQGEAPNYAVRQHWDLGNRSHWDYASFDSVHHRLFVTRGDRVDVIDPDSGKLIGQIPATAGVHGVAFAQDLKLGFTSNGRADSVTVFDLERLKTLREVKVSGKNPDAILYDDSTHKLYTFNGKSADVSVFDAATMKPLARMAVGGKPEFAATDGKGRIFVNIEDRSEIVVIDAHADKVLTRWPLKNCNEPTGLAFDDANARLFSVCANNVMAVTDSNNGRQVAQVSIGAHPDAAVYDAASATVFASNGEGTLSIVHQRDADHYEQAVSLPTAKGARTMAFDHASKRAYLPTVVDQKFIVLVVEP
jgi:DNA-binding beta-propeller fold protein YncE